jgi:carboxyl-terminal processing protease
MSERIEDIMSDDRRRPSPWQPLIYAVLLIIGVYIGSSFGGDTVLVQRSGAGENPNKLVNIINKIDEMYVDSVEKKALIDKAIGAMLEDLDPHSYYITAEELQAVQEPLQGNFEGIGVEFMIQRDTLVVVSPIQGGPSEEAGILAGDKIVSVDGEVIAGTELTNSRVMKLLKGEKGTEVQLGIQRGRKKDLLDFTIVRDRIPIHSVVASLMVSPEVGYLKLTRFAKNSYEEFIEGMEELVQQGAKRILLDLRGNGGGYLNVAIPMVEEFLREDQLIVYTEGKASPRYDYRSQRTGRYADLDVVVMINQGSASASEILAGALQDHDRSITVGRRSFGKGLVQDEIALPDNSALRLTVARYYTPTGRSIQRPYGEDIDYENDYHARYESGELMSRDSIEVADSLMYRTPAGRIVYGGGGILPDIFVPLDTVGASFYLTELSYNGILREYGFEYANTHRETLEAYGEVNRFLEEFNVTSDMFDGIVALAEKEGIARDEYGLNESRDVIAVRLKAHIARSIFDEESYYRMLLEDDTIFKEALRVAEQYDSYRVVEGTLTLVPGGKQQAAVSDPN